MDEVKIRVATVNDIADIYNLEKQYPIDMYSMDIIESSLSGDYYKNLVITFNDKVVGYISITIIFEECNLVKIIIDEAYRNRGYATRLINHIISDARLCGVQKIFLEVRADNYPAQNLYKKIGFKKTNTREKYYADGEDADIYWYFLDDREN